MIDTNRASLRAIVAHDHCIRIIVDKVDTTGDDIKLSELALSLLVTMVAIDDNAISLMASNKILEALKQMSLVRGHRNKYKVLLARVSVKDVLRGSWQYDLYSLTLLNCLVMSRPNVAQRMDERRLLSSERFDQILHKLEDRARGRGKGGGRGGAMGS